MATPRRAPRLGPDERLAHLLTRRGRFTKVDPLTSRRLPHWPKVVGVIAWAAFVAESLRRAWAGGDADRPGRR